MIQGNYSVSAGAQVGQISLGLVAAGILGLMLFYMWTKGIQR